MNSAEEQPSGDESPLVIKSRKVPRTRSASESEEHDEDPNEASNDNDPEEATDDGSSEDEDDAEELPQPVAPLAAKPQASVATHNTARLTYGKMVVEAMKILNENRRTGVSISKLVKYVGEKYDVPDNRVRFFCKKAIEKGLQEETYVHTTGAGMTGSISFSPEYWKNWKNEQRKASKAAEKKEKQKTAAKPKPPAKPKPAAKPKPTLKAKPKPKPSAAKEPKVAAKPKQDKNNNTIVGKVVAAKPKKNARLSISLPMAQVKPKRKLGPAAPNNKPEKAEAKEQPIKKPKTTRQASKTKSE